MKLFLYIFALILANFGLSASVICLPIIMSNAVNSNGYFVDSVNGNNSNNGRLPWLPLKTISAVPNLVPGQSVWLAKNSFFREQLTVPTNSITVDTYGSGAMPVIDCSDIIPTNVWIKTTGLTNTYQMNYSNADTVCFLTMYENSNRLVRATDVTNCDITAGSYWVSNDNVFPTGIFVHSAIGGNPATNGDVFETPTRSFAVDAWTYGFTNITIRGIYARRNLDNNGSIQCNGLVDGCWCVEGTKHNLLMEPGSRVQNCVCSNWYYISGGIVGGSPLILFTATGTGQNTTVSNCSITRTATTPDNSDGVDEHNGGTGFFGTVTVENCFFNQLGAALTPQCRYLIVSGSTITNTVTGVSCDSYLLFCTNDTISASSTGLSMAGGLASSNYVLGCTMTNSTASYQLSLNGIAGSIIVQNSNLGGTVCLYASTTNPIVTANHDRFVGSVPIFIQTTNQIISDFNSFATGSAFLSADANSDLSMSFSQWKTDSGQDSHSTNP